MMQGSKIKCKGKVYLHDNNEACITYELAMIEHSLFTHFYPSHLQISTGVMANYFKQVLGYKSTERNGKG